jgi:phage-related minor tail protein
MRFWRAIATLSAAETAMTDDPVKLRMDAAEAEAAVKALSREGEAAAGALRGAFEEAGAAISDALEDAARSGELSFRAMAEAITQDLAALALERLFDGPVADWTEQAGKGLGAALGAVLGQRAEGGPVLAGERYLVGERGPEVFTPATSGAVQPAGAPAVHVTINAGADAVESVRRSERQIAAAVARAASRGSRLI